MVILLELISTDQSQAMHFSIMLNLDYSTVVESMLTYSNTPTRLLNCIYISLARAQPQSLPCMIKQLMDRMSLDK